MTDKISKNAYRLDLPTLIRIHDVFNANLLTKDPKNPLPGQEEPEPPLIILDDEEEWKVEDIINIRKKRNKLEARAKWVGYTEDL